MPPLRQFRQKSIKLLEAVGKLTLSYFYYKRNADLKINLSYIIIFLSGLLYCNESLLESLTTLFQSNLTIFCSLLYVTRRYKYILLNICIKNHQSHCCFFFRAKVGILKESFNMSCYIIYT